MTHAILKSRSVRGAVAAVAASGMLAAIVAVGPSFAVSFLTHKQAAKTFVKRKEASRTYVTKKKAKADYAKAADLDQAEAQLPLSRISASTVDVGPLAGKDTFTIPQARNVFQTRSTTNVVITFSGQASCAGPEDGLGCPIQLLVDGSQAGTGKVNLLSSTAGGDEPKSVHTVVQSAIVTPGKHDVTVRYAGSEDGVALTLYDWNLIVQAYPGPDVVEEE